ncbi:MAG TPA: hypothetical protein VFQ05_01575 [Candidatus Eisenbacteria bacterium]|nr:hypothetical protein [Candidatus Eisenbacteria bacterium]
MRWQLLILLALSGLAFAPATQTLPRGTLAFTLGWARSQVDSALADRGVEPISAGSDFITTPGESPEVEFIEYSFVPMAHRGALLWKVTYGYRVPSDRQVFEGARGTLVGQFGAPHEEHKADVKAGNFEEKLLWVDGLTAVQLGARWTERQDTADRMMVTWVDRKLQKQASVQVKPKGGKKK